MQCEIEWWSRSHNSLSAPRVEALKAWEDVKILVPCVLLLGHSDALTRFLPFMDLFSFHWPFTLGIPYDCGSPLSYLPRPFPHRCGQARVRCFSMRYVRYLTIKSAPPRNWLWCSQFGRARILWKLHRSTLSNVAEHSEMSKLPKVHPTTWWTSALPSTHRLQVGLRYQCDW